MTQCQICFLKTLRIPSHCLLSRQDFHSNEHPNLQLTTAAALSCHPFSGLPPPSIEAGSLMNFRWKQNKMYTVNC